MGTDFKSVMLRARVNQWLGATKEAPSIEGASQVSATPTSGSHRGWGYRGTVRVLAESLGKSYPRPIRFFFGNVELSLELWTTIVGIAGFDD